MFVTSEGNGAVYGAFERALAKGELDLVRAHAAELPRVGLGDALRICLLLRDQDPERYDRAALRWAGASRWKHGRRRSRISASRSRPSMPLPERPQEAMDTLAGLCVEHRLAL